MSKGLFGRLQQELDDREKAAGLSMVDILELPDSLRQLVNWMMRSEMVSLSQVVAQVGQDEAATQAMLATLVEKGFVRQLEIKGELHYRVRVASQKKRTLPQNLWHALDDKVDEEKKGGE